MLSCRFVKLRAGHVSPKADPGCQRWVDAVDKVGGETGFGPPRCCGASSRSLDRCDGIACVIYKRDIKCRPRDLGLSSLGRLS